MADEKSLADLVVGDRFWLGYAQEMVKAAVSALDRRAEQITNGIPWFWTVYSTAALVILTTRTPAPPPLVSWLIALPMVLLIVAYYVASMVRAPFCFEFDPRVPMEIEAAHRQAVIVKTRTLAFAEAITGLAVICVALGILFAHTWAAPPKTEIQSYVDDQGSGKLLLLANLPKDAVVRIRVQTAGTTTTPAKEISELHRASTTGELRAALAVPEAPAYRVSATWKEDKVVKSITIPVKRDDPH